MSISNLPALNATLNLTSLILLLAGYACMRRGHIAAHKRLMIAAFAVSVAFLVSYVSYRVLGEEKRFGGLGWIRPVYFFVLITHVTLAATVPVLASITLWRGLRSTVERHRRIARWTFPIWVYVSLTGVVVYWLLFVMYGPQKT